MVYHLSRAVALWARDIFLIIIWLSPRIMNSKTARGGVHTFREQFSQAIVQLAKIFYNTLLKGSGERVVKWAERVVKPVHESAATAV